MTIASLGAHCRNAAAPVLLAAGMLMGSVCVAQAQLNPQELLKQVLPGASGGDTGDDDAAGERACQRYAEKQGLDVRRRPRQPPLWQQQSRDRSRASRTATIATTRAASTTARMRKSASSSL